MTNRCSQQDPKSGFATNWCSHQDPKSASVTRAQTDVSSLSSQNGYVAWHPAASPLLDLGSKFSVWITSWTCLKCSQLHYISGHMHPLGYKLCLKCGL